MKKGNFTFLMALLAMGVLILWGPEAVRGASQGIEICIRTVIPSLFPFFVVSVLLTGSAGNQRVFAPLGKLFSVAAGAEPILVTGLLGGYPVGARGADEAFRQGYLSKSEASRMIAFCSQPGPAFLFGVVSSMFSGLGRVWGLWVIQLLSAWIVARTMAPPVQVRTQSTLPQEVTLPQALRSALGIMAEVCGWVVLFRVLIHMTGNLPFNWHGRVVVAGILELTNGCLMLQEIPSENLRFLLCSGFLSWGGLCVLMQTCSAARGLDIRFYIRGKLLQTPIAVVLALIYLWRPVALVLPVLFAGVFSEFREKRGGNPARVVV